MVSGRIVGAIGNQRVLLMQQPTSLVGKRDDRVLLDQLMTTWLRSLIHKRDHRILFDELLSLVQQRCCRWCGTYSTRVNGDCVLLRHCRVLVTQRGHATRLHVRDNRVLLGQRHLAAVAVLLAEQTTCAGRGVAAGALLLDQQLSRAMRVLLEQHLLRQVAVLLHHQIVAPQRVVLVNVRDGVGLAQSRAAGTLARATGMIRGLACAGGGRGNGHVVIVSARRESIRYRPTST